MMLLILLLSVNVCFGIELTGSEHPYLRDDHRRVEKHKPLPFVFQPLYFKGIEGVNAPVLPVTEVITVTKTLVIETTKHVFKQPVCLKVYPGIPYCRPNVKVLATPVLQPIQEATKVIGILEDNKELHQGREGRHIIPAIHPPHLAQNIVRKFHTVTEILRVTKVEQYLDGLVTATLIPHNCIPVNEEMPLCPVKVDHYVHPYRPPIGHIPVFGKDAFNRRIDQAEEDTAMYSDESTNFNSSLLF